jgi:hypothetical protein
MRGDESQFAAELEAHLRAQVPFSDSVDVCVGECILYKLEIDTAHNVYPREPRNPKRGQYAFETDILIRNKQTAIPLVVIELKVGNFSTHDVITYSAKATHHKEVYPYLRYGFVVRGKKPLTRKFLTHNQGIDFAMSVPKADDEDLVKLIQRQTRQAERLVEIMREREQTFTLYEKHFDVRT